MKIRYVVLRSPVGPIALAWHGSTILSALMEEASDRRGWGARYVGGSPRKRLKEDLEKRFGDVELLRAAPDARPVRALRKYFAGDLHALDRLRVDPGGTAFQAKVWARLRRIPAGKTTTYGELANAAGRPGAARAAGGAVGRNPISVVIPCHRVIGSDRRLNGFGGGLKRKRWLLEHEGARFRER